MNGKASLRASIARGNTNTLIFSLALLVNQRLSRSSPTSVYRYCIVYTHCIRIWQYEAASITSISLSLRPSIDPFSRQPAYIRQGHGSGRKKTYVIVYISRNEATL